MRRLMPTAKTTLHPADGNADFCLLIKSRLDDCGSVPAGTWAEPFRFICCTGSAECAVHIRKVTLANAHHAAAHADREDDHAPANGNADFCLLIKSRLDDRWKADLGPFIFSARPSLAARPGGPIKARRMATR